MYAIQLPSTIPAAGTPGGPPLPEDYRYFGGAPGFDCPRDFHEVHSRSPTASADDGPDCRPRIRRPRRRRSKMSLTIRQP